MPGQKRKSPKQIRFLFSEGSPLSVAEKEKLKSEIRSGVVTVRGGKSAIRRKPSKAETRRRVARLRRTREALHG